MGKRPRRNRAKEEALEDEALMLRSTERLAWFVRSLWRVAVPADLVWAPHMQIICDEVQDCFTEADRRRGIAEGILKAHPGDQDAAAIEIEQALGSLDEINLVLLVPPRHSKSAIVQKLLPAWRWLHRPQEQFLCLASAEHLVVRDGLALRDVVKSQKYRDLQAYKGATFGLRPDQFAKSKFNNTAGGTRQGLAIGSRITGADSDATILDDPHDADDAFRGSPEQVSRRMAEDQATYEHKIKDRQNNPLWGIRILIMQRLHESDLAAYMIDQGARVVCLPGLYDPEHPQVYPDDWRAPGEPLNPLRFPLSWHERIRAIPNGLRAYTTKVGQRPSPTEGLRFKRYLWGRFAGDPRQVADQAIELWSTTDCANEEKREAAFSVIHVMGRFKTPQGYRIRVLDEWRAQVEYDDLEAGWLMMSRRWPRVAQHLIEYAANGITLYQRMSKRHPGCVKVKPRGDAQFPGGSKEDRAAHTLAKLQAGELELPQDLYAPWAQEIIEEHAAFPSGTYKDRVDTISQACVRWTVTDHGAAWEAVMRQTKDPRPGLPRTDEMSWLGDF